MNERWKNEDVKKNNFLLSLVFLRSSFIFIFIFLFIFLYLFNKTNFDSHVMLEFFTNIRVIYEIS